MLLLYWGYQGIKWKINIQKQSVCVYQFLPAVDSPLYCLVPVSWHLFVTTKRLSTSSAYKLCIALPIIKYVDLGNKKIEKGQQI